MENLDANRFRGQIEDIDPLETQEWTEAFDALIRAHGRERAQFMIARLVQQAWRSGIRVPQALTTPYVNSIPVSEQHPFPGDRRIERRLKSIIRWNAMAMVVNANNDVAGIGGHISTYASAATLYEIGFNHFFRGRTESFTGDLIYFQGHASPGIYARAFVEHQLEKSHLHKFRQELAGGGLSSYPHPRLMREFWQFPTVSMGLSAISAIYQARFVRYLKARGLLTGEEPRIWAFMGDGETDEPESLGALTLASRERLDNLTFVVNCNLQRLDGPVRGNGKIIQELEAAFRGAGWNVIKVIWGGTWDPLLAEDKEGILVKRMEEALDGDYQKYVVEPGSYVREHFFGKYPSLLKQVEDFSDVDIRKLGRGGHDPVKVYAGYKAATEHRGHPTVILAKAIKGYGMGEAGEGRNITHQQKKLNEDELKHFRDRFQIPVSDQELKKGVPFFRPDKRSIEFEYMMECRKRLGGHVPTRKSTFNSVQAPVLSQYKELTSGTGADREVSTTMAFVRLLSLLLKSSEIGKLIVPIVPDEARTFGMESLFRLCGIYSSKGQLYKPVDSHVLLYYKEAVDGQILEEGITEAGSMASFQAAGTAYSTLGVNTIPFFIYYSMFGFQRIGDSIWACADSLGKGFLMGGTAGRTTLNGEGLQHQDGHSHILAATVPNVVAYDPAYAYEVAVIVQDGLRRMYGEKEDIFYYITLYNENYTMPGMPRDAEEGILKGLYKVSPAELTGKVPRVHLFGSGPILNHALTAQKTLAEKYSVAADVWSATSYKEMRREALEMDRWNRLHPTETPRKPYVTTVLEKEPWPVVAATDYMKLVPEQVAPWVPGGMVALGTDGFGRSDARSKLRRHFEVDAECIVIAALHELSRRGDVKPQLVAKAITDLGVDPEKIDPVSV